LGEISQDSYGSERSYLGVKNHHLKRERSELRKKQNFKLQKEEVAPVRGQHLEGLSLKRHGKNKKRKVL